MAQQHDHKRAWREFYADFIDGLLKEHPEVGHLPIDREEEHKQRQVIDNAYASPIEWGDVLHPDHPDQETLDVFEEAGLERHDWEWAR